MDEKIWTTYRLEDGSPIFGDYSWVDGTEFFEDVTETTKVIKETWVLQDSEVITFEPVFWAEEDYEDEED
jgi:hypothetical protein